MISIKIFLPTYVGAMKEKAGVQSQTILLESDATCCVFFETTACFPKVIVESGGYKELVIENKEFANQLINMKAFHT